MTFVRAVLLIAVLVGIVGMHSLAGHCPSPMGGHADDAAITALAYQGDHAGSHSSDVDATAPMQQRAGVVDTHAGGDHLGLVGACIAGLVGFALFLAFAHARGQRGWWRVQRWVGASRPRIRSLVTRPPTLAELSLLRC
jgi:hypothetical protein